MNVSIFLCNCPVITECTHSVDLHSDTCKQNIRQFLHGPFPFQSDSMDTFLIYSKLDSDGLG